VAPRFARGFVFAGAGRAKLSKADARTKLARRWSGEATWVMQMRGGSGRARRRRGGIIQVGQRGTPRFARGFVFLGVNRASSGERTGKQN